MTHFMCLLLIYLSFTHGSASVCYLLLWETFNDLEKQPRSLKFIFKENFIQLKACNSSYINTIKVIVLVFSDNIFL